MSRKIQLLLVWCGPATAVLFAIGFIPLAHFIPPPHPADSAEQIKSFYLAHLDGIRIGMLICMFSMALVAPWAISIAIQFRRDDTGSRALVYTQLFAMTIGMALLVLCMLVYGVAAYRPDDIAPETTRMLNDFGWILFLWPWQPFSIWFAAVGLAILKDKSVRPVYPRWAAYLSFWGALTFTPESLIIFFKSGPFGYNGLVAMYIPVVVFFIWVIAMTVLTIKRINSEPDRTETETETEPARRHSGTPVAVGNASS